MSDTTRLPVYVAIILCILAVNGTYQFHRQLTERIAQQDKLIVTRQTWNNELTAMQPLEAQWNKTLPATSALSDQYRILQHIDAQSFGLALADTGLIIGEPTLLSHAGQPIGLLRYPVANQNATLRLTAPDFATAWHALTALQKRNDLRFTHATLTNDRGVPALLLDGFSVIARLDAR